MTPIDRNSVLAAGLVVVTLLLGMVSGVALDRWMLRPRAEYVELPRGPGRPGMPGRFDPAQFKQRMSAQLTRELALTDEQRIKVDSILSAQQAVSRGVMEEVRPRLQQVAESTQAAIRAVLTPEQQEQLQKLREVRMMRRDEVRRRAPGRPGN